MTSLVDYLQDKLNHADEPVPFVEVPGFVGYGYGLQVAVWSDGMWRCLRCEDRGQTARAEVLNAAWEHLATHRPKPKKRWWRR